MGTMLVKFPTPILTVGQMLPSACCLSQHFDWSKLRMFTFQLLQGIPLMQLNLVKNIKRFNFIQHTSGKLFYKSQPSLIFSHFFCHYQFVCKINENIISKNKNSNPCNFFSKLTLAARAYCVYIGRPIRPLKRLWEIY